MSESCLWRWNHAQLHHQAKCVHDDARVLDFSAFQAVDHHAPNRHRSVRSGYAEKRPPMCACPKEARKTFEKLARKGSYKIIHIAKGTATMSLGLVNVAKASEKPVFRSVDFTKESTMSITAILYGLHANLPALEAVLTNAKNQGVSRFVCLGDIVSAGPNPIECLEWVKKCCNWSLAGYRDRCLVNLDLLQFSSTVYKNETVVWNRELVLENSNGKALIDYIKSLPSIMIEQETCFVYGSLRSPESRYLPNRLQRDRRTYYFENATEEFDSFPQSVNLVFSGRLGCPCVVYQDGMVKHASVYGYNKPFPIPSGHKLAVNVGSVGFPQDGDPRASYVIYDDESKKFCFQRCEYDIDTVLNGFSRATCLSKECLKQMIRKHKEGW